MQPYLLHHILENGQRDTGVALRHGEAMLCYDGLRAAVARCAGNLRRRGLRRGDRVAIYLPKSLEECWAIFAVSMAGGVFVPVNPLLKGPQVRHIIGDCGARFVISNRALFGDVRDHLSDIDDLDVSLIEDAVEDGPQSGELPCVLGGDLAAILYTSGSTGRAKGVMLSHANLLAGVRIVTEYLSLTAEDRILSLLPFSFDYGLNQLLTSVAAGGELVLSSFRFGDEIVTALRDHRITGLAGVPTIWTILATAAPSLATGSLGCLRYITNSGGAVPTATIARLRALLPATEIFLMYGLTEAFRSTYLPPDQIDRRPTSIGKAIPETEILVLTEEGREAAPGETGILVHRGPTVSLGYWNRPEDTARVIRPNPLKHPHEGPDMVCVSGDLVRRDEDGYLYFVGRKDAMIKSSGYRVSPTEVEEALMQTGAFRQVAVIGLPDTVAGQRIHAVGVANAGAPSAREILSQCARLLPAYMMPRQVELVAALPKSPNGKVDVKSLVAERIQAFAAAS